MFPREEEPVWAGPTCLYIYKLYFCYVYIFDTLIRTGALLTFLCYFLTTVLYICYFSLFFFLIFSEGLIEHCQQIQVLKLFFRTPKFTFFCFLLNIFVNE